ncbi:MAG: hypothetical protein ABL951_02610 [Alphaproteobacteria bacterium]
MAGSLKVDKTFMVGDWFPGSEGAATDADKRMAREVFSAICRKIEAEMCAQIMEQLTKLRNGK